MLIAGNGGTAGSGTSADDVYGGPGAYAGIHCWDNGSTSSTLNLVGYGEIYCYGGDAGDGGVSIASNFDAGGGGGGGAGAGIGGNGGTGGTGIQFDYSDTMNGFDGEKGGNVNIHDEVVV